MSSGSDNIAVLHLEKEIPIRIILVGKTGSGKSTLGNILLARQDVKDEEYEDSPSLGFATCDGMEPGSMRCQSKNSYNNIFGRRVEIIDSPGLCDTRSVDLMTTLQHVMRVLCLSAPGPHAVLYVVRCDVKFTVDEETAFLKTTDMLGDGVCKHTIIVFTHGDQLKIPLQSLLARAPECLKKVIGLAGDNYALMSKTEDMKTQSSQLENLFQKIEKVCSGGKEYYSNDILKKLSQAIEEDVKNILEVEDIPYKEAYAHVKEHISFDREICLKMFIKLSVILLKTTLFAVVVGIIGGSIALAYQKAASNAAVIVGGVSALATLARSLSRKITTVPKCNKMYTAQ